MNRLTLTTLAIPLALLLTACGTGTTTTQPLPESTATVAPQPPETTGDTDDRETGSYRTGEAVGTTTKELWEETKEFGRGFWNELTQEDPQP
jgi:hypothetical protein